MTPFLDLFLCAALVGSGADPAPEIPTTFSAWEPATVQDERPSAPGGQDPNGSGPNALDLGLDFGIAIIGSDVITVGDMAGILAEPRYRQRLASGESQIQVQFDALVDLTMMRLEIDAGVSRGFPRDLVDDRVQLIMEERIREQGGHHAFSRALTAQGMTPVSFRELLTDLTFRGAWRRWATGEDVGPKGRRSIDRYIRPGMMHMTHELLLDSPLESEREMVGAAPQRYVLRRLRLAPAPGQNPNQALPILRQRAIDIVGDIEGELSDFDGALSAFDRDRGVNAKMSPASLDTLQRAIGGVHGPNQTVTSALPTMEVGDLTDVQVILGSRGQTLGYAIYELHEILPARQGRPFVNLEVQQRLQEHLVGLVDDRRLLQGQLLLLQAGHVYPEAIKRDVAASLIQGE